MEESSDAPKSVGGLKFGNPDANSEVEIDSGRPTNRIGEAIQS